MTTCNFKRDVPKKCQICGETTLHDITEYMSYNTFGLPFYLDTFRCEPEPVGANLMTCPKCGYVAHDISETIRDKRLIKKVMKSEEYIEFAPLYEAKDKEEYRKYLIEKERGNYSNALFMIILLCEGSDDGDSKKDYCRHLALDLLEKIIIQEVDLEIRNNLIIQRTDLLRRCGEFENALRSLADLDHTIVEKGRQSHGLSVGLLEKFEKDKCSAKDRRKYSYDDARLEYVSPLRELQLRGHAFAVDIKDAKTVDVIEYGIIHIKIVNEDGKIKFGFKQTDDEEWSLIDYKGDADTWLERINALRLDRLKRFYESRERATEIQIGIHHSTYWNLDVQFEDGRKNDINCSDVFPENWSDLLSMIGELDPQINYYLFAFQDPEHS